MISIYIIKLIKSKLQKAINSLDSQIQDIIDFWFLFYSYSSPTIVSYANNCL